MPSPPTRRSFWVGVACAIGVLAMDTGVAGLSIEDSTGDASEPLRDIASSVERMRAARAAIDEAGDETLLVGRAENFISTASLARS